MAVTNMLATIPGKMIVICNVFASLDYLLGFLVPLLCGVLTDGTEGLGPWYIVFYMTIGILAFEALIFTIFGTGEMQPWNGGKK